VHEAADRNGERRYKVVGTMVDGLLRASVHGVRFVVGGCAASRVEVAIRGTAANVAVVELEVAFVAIVLGLQCRSLSLVVFSLTNMIEPRSFSVFIVVKSL